MGQLKPDVQYVYEKVDGITYAREFGSTTRKIIGIDYEVTSMQEEAEEDALWRDIRKVSKDNPSLSYLLERAKLIYELSRKQ